MTRAAQPLPVVWRRAILTVVVVALAGLGLRCHGAMRDPHSVPVQATGETEPVPSDGDAADDVAIWVHPTRPEASTILGTDKKEGLAVYDLQGRQLDFAADGDTNNVDLRQDVAWGGERVDLAVATNKSHNALAVYRLADEGRALELAGMQALGEEIEAEGLCLYLSPGRGAGLPGGLFAFVTGKGGRIEQWALRPGGDGRPDFERVRAWDMDVVLEGCVADDESGRLYVSAEQVGVWVWGAEPDAPAGEPELLDTVGLFGRLRDDVEGLAIFRQPDGAGYLLASSQGSDDFVVYDRLPPHAYRGRFRVLAAGGADPVTHTDGIDVTSAALGGPYGQGLFVAQDDEHASGRQNFKLVPWSAIAEATGLAADR